MNDESKIVAGCHVNRVPFVVWSLSAATESGFPVSITRLQDLEEWSVRLSSFVGPDGEESYHSASALSSSTDTMNMLLLGLGGKRHVGEE